MAHRAIKRLGPTGLIAIFVALTMSLIGDGAATRSRHHEKGSPRPWRRPGRQDEGPGVTGTTEDGRKVNGSFTPRKFHR